MSVPADFMQQMLGGLLQYNQPSVTSGLLSGSDPTTNFGLSLLANSNSGGRFGQILGKSALDTQQMGMQNAMNRLQLAQGAVGLGATLQKQQAINDYLSGGQPSGSSAPAGAPQQQAPAPQQAFMPGISQMPADGSQPSAAPQGSAQTFQQPQQVAGYSASNNDISQLPINGIPAPTYKRLAVLMGKDPLTVEKETYEQQLKVAQAQAAPQISALETIAKSDKPTQYVAADAQLHQLWNQVAPTLGFNPVKDFTDQNVRTVLTTARNKIASGVQLGSEAPNVPLQTVKLPDGRTAQVDQLSGKMNVESPGSLVKVVGRDGKPVLVPEAKAVGMRPYNEMTAASDEALQSTAEDVANYKIAPPSGSKLLSGNWPEVMHLVKSLNPDYDGTQFAMKNRARQQFATGKQGDIVRSLSVATDHLDQLSQAADAMKNGQLPVANSVVNFFSKQTGNPNVTNFDAMKEIVGDEVVKAVVGATGAAGDREAIKKTFSAANSPAQLQGVIQKYKGLMGGQLKGLRQQYERSTGLKDFESAISPQAEAELNPSAAASAHPADITALLDKYK